MSEASEDTRVQIKGTFSVKRREDNGLNRVAEYLNANRLDRVPVVALVQFVRHVDTREGDEMTVEIVAVEPAVEADGTDPHGHGKTVRALVETLRKGAGKAAVGDTLFDPAKTAALDAELDGQIALDVPEKSGEELAAERAEGVPAADLSTTDAKPATGRKARPATVRPASDPFTPAAE